jgi:hypothetical protein
VFQNFLLPRSHGRGSSLAQAPAFPERVEFGLPGDDSPTLTASALPGGAGGTQLDPVTLAQVLLPSRPPLPVAEDPGPSPVSHPTAGATYVGLGVPLAGPPSQPPPAVPGGELLDRVFTDLDGDLTSGVPADGLVLSNPLK